MRKRLVRPVVSALVVLAVAAVASYADWFGHIFDGGQEGGKPPEAQATPSTVGAPTEEDPRVWVVLSASDKETRSRIANAGVSIEEVHGDSVAGIATPKALRRLQEKGFSVRTQIRLKDFPAPDKAFRNYERVQQALHAVADGHPDLVSMVEIGDSLKHLKISGLRFNTTARGLARSAKPGIVFLGTHHAREHLSTEVPLLLAQWLADHRDQPDVKRLLETRDVFIIPLVNPDGSEFDIATGDYKWQRKNMRRNGDGSTGVDLNRNYSFHWGEGGASNDPGDETYRGTGPFSEPETRAVKAFVESRDNLKIILSYHTFSELILYPWGYTYDPLTDGPALKAYKAMAEQMAQWTGYKPEQSSDLYIASGDTTDWAWGAHHIFSFTFELTPKSMWEGGFYPGAGAIGPTFAKNIQPALYLLDLADNPYRAGNGQVSRVPNRFAPLIVTSDLE